MKNSVKFQTLLTPIGPDASRQMAVFALLNLGVIESILSGRLTASEAVELVYHAENCLFIHERFGATAADEIMSRGVQLPDLLDILPLEAAQRELYRELDAMRSLCLTLLEHEALAA